MSHEKQRLCLPFLAFQGGGQANPGNEKSDQEQKSNKQESWQGAHCVPDTCTQPFYLHKAQGWGTLDCEATHLCVHSYPLHQTLYFLGWGCGSVGESMSGM